LTPLRKDKEGMTDSYSAVQPQVYNKLRERGKGKRGKGRVRKLVPHFLDESYASANEILLSKRTTRQLRLHCNKNIGLFLDKNVINW